MLVPLAGRREPLGVLWLVTATGSGSGTDPEAVAFAEELARRAAIAVENARLFARQRSVSETLQQSLLPERLPEIPGLATAAHYLPGGPDVEVGGDWYDVMQLPGGGIGLAMGDVVGRGERAAALMGQLRNAVRAYAFEGKSPGEVMDCVNGLLLDAGSEHMATMIYAVLDPESGELRMVNAGHPPPLLVARGTARFLEGAERPAGRRAARRPGTSRSARCWRRGRPCCSTPTGWWRTGRHRSNKGSNGCGGRRSTGRRPGRLLCPHRAPGHRRRPER